MTLFSALIRVVIDKNYRKEQLKTDKKSLFLIIFGLPIGVIGVFSIFLFLTEVIGERTAVSIIEQMRPFICRAWFSLTESVICID